MKRFTLLLVLVCAVVLAVFIFSPLWGGHSFSDGFPATIFRLAIVFVLVPLGLFYMLHPTSHFEKKRKERVDLLLGLGGLAALGALILLGRGNYTYGAATVIVAFLLLFFARLCWLRANPNHRQIIIRAGEKILSEENDPSERRKFATALDRFKKG